MKSDKPFLERYFYDPTLLQKGLIFALYPFSLIYQFIATIKRKIAKKHDFKIPIISIGNLIAGGSGKTPFILEIAPRYQEVAVVSRGYQRDSKGLVVVSVKGNILVPQKTAGDEAYLLALNLKQASVIVSEKRELGVLKALELGAKIVFLDDGFRFNFNQFNALLKPKVPPTTLFVCLAGCIEKVLKAIKKPI
ncbi:tetraacyldisaccharide 4'-kinase [Helicobacter pylori]|uniref:Tetraacyldisaccharide 4'-kinase n=1 Tax=Helicobacter pylori TaxID=210 RepID=A0A377IRY8_HELPX|nr:tetraacyldisaccharide 4'-kinase [Helicobacter pylori]